MANESSVKDWISTITSRMVRQLSEGRIFALEDAIDELEDLSLTDRQIEATLRPYANEIAGWAGKRLKDRLEDTMDQVMNLIEIKAHWPPLVSVLNDHKVELVRYMLILLRSTKDTDMIGMWCESLIEAGIDWPELGIIMKSVNADANVDLSESDDIDIGKMIHDTGKQIGKDQTSLVLRGLIAKLTDSLDIDRKDIHDLLKPISHQIAYKLDRDLSGKAIGIGIGDLSALVKWSVVDGPMMDAVERHKDQIIRWLLTKVREHSSSLPVLTWIETLDAIGVDWPELAIIRRSADKEFAAIQRRPWMVEGEQPGWPASAVLSRIRAYQGLALSHSIEELRYDNVPDSVILKNLEPHDAEIAAWLDGVLSAPINPGLDDKTVFQAILLMTMGANWPEVSKVFRKHRDRIIKRLLEKVRDAVGQPQWRSISMSNIGRIIKSIVDNGFDWPELAIMHKSVTIGGKDV